jgi:hypothetical protein
LTSTTGVFASEATRCEFLEIAVDSLLADELAGTAQRYVVVGIGDDEMRGRGQLSGELDGVFEPA